MWSYYVQIGYSEQWTLPTERIPNMFLTFLLLMLIAFIPFQVYKAVVAWRLTKGIKEFKERNFKGVLPPFDPVPSELNSFSFIFMLIAVARCPGCPLRYWWANYCRNHTGVLFQ